MARSAHPFGRLPQEGTDVKNSSCCYPGTPPVRDTPFLFQFQSGSIQSEIKPFAENVATISGASPGPKFAS